jgi:hypothetical protein
MKPAYRQDSGDTITLYTYDGSIAEDLKTFKETAKSKDFNIFRYPTATQDNETVIVVKMGRSDFIWRNDTLYVLDSYNAERNTQAIKVMEEHWAGTLNDNEYGSRMKELEGEDFGFKPRYKAIYFTGIFNENHSYTFPATENFRHETVSWTGASFMQGKKYFEINLVTNHDGRYRFSEDMNVLETTNCFQ